MPSYPLAFPASPYPQKVMVRPRVAVAGFDNDYTLQQHVQLLSNARRFDIDVFLQKMDRAGAALWTQFLYDLQGRFGTFQFDITPWCPGLAIGATTAEIFTVDFVGMTPAGLANKYVTAEDALGSVYFWFNLDSAGVDPAPGGRGIAVPIATGQTDAQLASAFATVVDADGSFSASVSTTVATVTNSALGARTDATAGNSGTTVATTQQGVGTPPGLKTFRLVLDDPGWDAELAVEFGFSFSAVEAL